MVSLFISLIILTQNNRKLRDVLPPSFERVRADADESHAERIEKTWFAHSAERRRVHSLE